MRYIFNLSLIFISILCSAQKQDRVWIFGDHGGVNFNDTSNVTSFYSGLSGYFTLANFASISSSTGNLLFYAAADQLSLEGINVYNRNDTLMLGGDNLAGHPAQTQCVLILPYPGDTTRYYIFHKTQYNSKNNLFYSIVDMNQDAGLGAVVSKNNNIPTDSLTQRTTAVKHANGRDWWLIQQRWDQDEYLKFLITPLGIQGPIRQATANSKPKEEFYGTSTFSRSGNRLVSVGQYGNINLMNFDRCTGDIYNYQQIGAGIATHAYGYMGCAFSPDENVLYVSNVYPDGKYVYQYDLTAPDIKASVQVICFYPDTGLLQNVQLGYLLLGPDNKIYVSKGNGSGPNSNTIYSQNLDVILNPDVIGTGCNYRTNHFYLNGGRVTIGLPNMINYGLGTEIGTICDSLSTGLPNYQSKSNELLISPNPASDKITFHSLQNLITDNPLHISVISSEGRKVLERELVQDEFSVSISELENGFYVIWVNSTKNTFVSKFVKSQ